MKMFSEAQIQGKKNPDFNSYTMMAARNCIYQQLCSVYLLWFSHPSLWTLLRGTLLYLLETPMMKAMSLTRVIQTVYFISLSFSLPIGFLLWSMKIILQLKHTRLERSRVTTLFMEFRVHDKSAATILTSVGKGHIADNTRNSDLEI